MDTQVETLPALPPLEGEAQAGPVFRDLVEFIAQTLSRRIIAGDLK